MRNGVVLIAFLIFVGIIIALSSRDIPPPDVTDLKVERPEVAPDENAYTFLESAAHSFHWPTNSLIVTDYLAGRQVAQEEILEVIDRNKEMLGIMDQVARCSICLAPEITGFDSLLTYIGEWRNMGRVMALEARYRRLSGDYQRSVSTCISLLRFGDLVQHDAECIINYLVGIAITELGLQQVRDLAIDEGTTDRELSALAGTLADLGPFDHGFDRAIKMEYKMVSSTLDDFASGKINMDQIMAVESSDTESSGFLKGRRVPRYFLQPNRTKALFADYYREMLGNSSLAYADMNMCDKEEMFCLDESKHKLMTRPNAVGKILCRLLVPAIESILERRCRIETGVAATHLIVALNMYEKEHGEFPGKLSELVPGHIAAVPSDSYDGKPLRYDPDRKLVYSVGKDLEDSGGSSDTLSGDDSDLVQRRRWDAKDIVFEIKEETNEPDSSDAAGVASPATSMK